MDQEINLLKAQRRRLDLKKISRPVKIGFLVFLIGYILVALAIFSYFTYLNYNSFSLKREIESKKGQIQQMKKVESLLVISKQRLGVLGDFLGKKTANYASLLEKIRSLTAEEVNLDKLEIEETGNILLHGQADNAVVLASFLERILGEKTFTDIRVNTLSRAKTGIYNFELLIETKL